MIPHERTVLPASPSEKREPPPGLAYRFPVVAPQTAEFRVSLLPFADAPEGFQGTLEGLLEGLRRNALSLDHLPLAPLVDQYLAFCQRLAEDENPSERLSDFLPLAATLIHLKSRLFLPQEPTATNQPTVAQEILEEIRREERRQRARREESGQSPPAEPEPERLTLLDLMVLLNDVRNELRAPLSVSEQGLTVRDAMRWICGSLPSDRALVAETYFACCDTRRDQAAVFLAILELGKSQFVTCHQAEAFSPIWLCTTADGPSVAPTLP